VCDGSRDLDEDDYKNSKIAASPGMAKRYATPLVLEGGHKQIGAFRHAAETPLAPDSIFSARCGSVQFGRMK
jgi:hypothetical protein